MDRWTDRRTNDMRSQDRALHYSASRSKNDSNPNPTNHWLVINLHIKAKTEAPNTYVPVVNSLKLLLED